jgi:hypothetical protein
VSAGAFAKRQLQQCRRGGYRGAQSRSWLRHSLRHLALLHGRAVARSCRFFTSNQAMPTRSLTHSFVFLHATKISSNRRGARGLESTPSAGPRPMARAGAGERANQRRPPSPPLPKHQHPLPHHTQGPFAAVPASRGGRLDLIPPRGLAPTQIQSVSVNHGESELCQTGDYFL